MGEQEFRRTDVIEQGSMSPELVQHHAPVICVTNRRHGIWLREGKNHGPNSQSYFTSIGLRNWLPPGLSIVAASAHGWGPAMIDHNRKCSARKIFVAVETQTLY